ncbi:MAG: eight-cysteine-cluster domain-containing protein [Candidatus Nealsonbacteria bacterium]
MKTVAKIIITLFIIVIILVGIWFSLDSFTKCKLIYGKNICNFYEMMDTVSHSPESSDFEKAMQLCREMEDVPKKDGCFEYIAEVVSFYDFEKAKQACDEMVGYGLVYRKDGCYQKIQTSVEERLAESVVVAFMEARLQRDEELAFSWLTDNAEGQYLLRSDLPLTGLSNPYFADFEIREIEKLASTLFKFKIRIYEDYTREGRVGYFEEVLIVIKIGDRYLIDSVKRGEYFNVKGEFCGLSTYGQCVSDSDCIVGGCSGHVCQSKDEQQIITTCEWIDCYNVKTYGVECKCVDNKCQWLK